MVTVELYSTSEDYQITMDGETYDLAILNKGMDSEEILIYDEYGEKSKPALRKKILLAYKEHYLDKK